MFDPFDLNAESQQILPVINNLYDWLLEIN